MLDPDAMPVADDGPSSSGSSGKSHGAGNAPGAGSTTSSGGGATGSGASGAAMPGTPAKGGGGPAGGATSSGSAGSGGAASIAPSAATACNGYCGVTTEGVCPAFGSFKECYSACLEEVGPQSVACQANASALLSCFTTAYQNGTNCAEIDQLYVAKCSDLALTYRSCIDPGPTPVPVQPPPPPAATCSTFGNSGNGFCSLGVKCDNGAYYTVSCNAASTGQSSCSCSSISPDGSGSGSGFVLNESVDVACYDSFAVCGFPQRGLK